MDAAGDRLDASEARAHALSCLRIAELDVRPWSDLACLAFAKSDHCLSLLRRVEQLPEGRESQVALQLLAREASARFWSLWLGPGAERSELLAAFLLLAGMAALSPEPISEDVIALFEAVARDIEGLRWNDVEVQEIKEVVVQLRSGQVWEETRLHLAFERLKGLALQTDCFVLAPERLSGVVGAPSGAVLSEKVDENDEDEHEEEWDDEDDDAPIVLDLDQNNLEVNGRLLALLEGKKRKRTCRVDERLEPRSGESRYVLSVLCGIGDRSQNLQQKSRGAKMIRAVLQDGDLKSAGDNSKLAVLRPVVPGERLRNRAWQKSSALADWVRRTSPTSGESRA